MRRNPYRQQLAMQFACPRSSFRNFHHQLMPMQVTYEENFDQVPEDRIYFFLYLIPMIFHGETYSKDARGINVFCRD